MLGKLRGVIDPDFGEDIVACGFIKVGAGVFTIVCRRVEAHG